MLITFGIHLYEICTSNVFLICLVYFQNCSNKKKSLWFQSIPLFKYPYTLGKMDNISFHTKVKKVFS